MIIRSCNTYSEIPLDAYFFQTKDGIYFSESARRLCLWAEWVNKQGNKIISIYHRTKPTINRKLNEPVWEDGDRYYNFNKCAYSEVPR